MNVWRTTVTGKDLVEVASKAEAAAATFFAYVIPVPPLEYSVY